jgi:DNA-binding transcriptional MerR regulator
MANQVPDALAQSPSIRDRIRRIMETPLVNFLTQDINGMSINEIGTLCTMNNIIPGQKGLQTLCKKLLALQADKLQEQRRQMPEQMPNPTQQDSTSAHQERPPSLSSHKSRSQSPTQQ